MYSLFSVAKPNAWKYEHCLSARVSDRADTGHFLQGVVNYFSARASSSTPVWRDGSLLKAVLYCHGTFVNAPLFGGSSIYLGLYSAKLEQILGKDICSKKIQQPLHFKTACKVLPSIFASLYARFSFQLIQDLNLCSLRAFARLKHQFCARVLFRACNLRGTKTAAQRKLRVYTLSQPI